MGNLNALKALMFRVSRVAISFPLRIRIRQSCYKANSRANNITKITILQKIAVTPVFLPNISLFKTT